MAACPAESEARTGSWGVTLVELLVALVVLSVGLLASAGMLRLGARELAEAERREAARWSVSALADSLMRGRAPPVGERSEPWGTLRWSESGSGTLLEGLRTPDGGGEPLVRVWLATAPAGSTSP